MQPPLSWPSNETRSDDPARVGGVSANRSAVAETTPEELAALRAEAEAAGAADAVARHELAYLTPEHIERAAVTRRNHDAQLLELGPAARAAHGAGCPLCIGRMLAVPEPVEDLTAGPPLSSGAPGMAGPSRPLNLTGRIRLLDDFLEVELISNPERVAGLVPGEGFCLVLGAEKTGKSLLGAQLALSVAAGIPFLGCTTSQCASLLVEEEGSEAALQHRLTMIAGALGVREAAPPLHVLHRSRWRLDDPDHVAAIADYISLHRVGLVVLGPLAQLADVEEENRAAGFNLVARNLADVATATHTTFVLLHHRRKPDPRQRKALTVKGFFDTSRGTNALTAAMDVGLGLDRDPEASVGELLVERRDGAPNRLRIRFERDTLTFSADVQPVTGPALEQRDRLLAYLREHEKITAAETQKLLGVSLNTAKDRLAVLEGDELVEQHRQRGGATVWFLKDGGNSAS
jgi:hypothetical protein